MMKGMFFDEIHSYKDLNLVLSSVSIPPAAVKTNYIDIPGADGSLDLTEALGAVRYKDRPCSFVFSVFPYEDFEEKKKQISNFLNGKKCKIRLDKDSEYYWLGRCSVNNYDSDRNLHKITVNATVDPYKYKVDETVVDIELCGDDCRTKAIGNPIRIANVSPLFDTIQVKASSENLIPFPYPESTTSGNGVTFTAQSDGGINVSGTATGQKNFSLHYGDLLADGVVTMSLSGDYENMVGVFILKDKSGEQLFNRNVDPSVTVDISEYPTAAKMELLIKRKINAAVSGTVYPKLEKGETATAYKSFVAVEGATMEASGKNFIPFPYYDKSKTLNGITFTVNDDGTIVANGTATANATFYVRYPSSTADKNTLLVKGNKDYTLTGCPSGGGATTYQMVLQGYSGSSFTMIDKGEGGTAKASADTLVYVAFTIYSGATVKDVVFKPQLEVGTMATEFEPFKKPTTYPINADGVIDGVALFKPTTTLLCNANSIVLEAEYFNESFMPKSVILENGKKSVVPIVECSDDDTTLEFDSAKVTVNAGKHKILDLQLKEGENPVTITGIGTIKFTYQEGDL